MNDALSKLGELSRSYNGFIDLDADLKRVSVLAGRRWLWTDSSLKIGLAAGSDYKVADPYFGIGVRYRW